MGSMRPIGHGLIRATVRSSFLIPKGDSLLGITTLARQKDKERIQPTNIVECFNPRGAAIMCWFVIYFHWAKAVAGFGLSWRITKKASWP